jgi:hypothetical protein
MASDYVKIYHSILRGHAARQIKIPAVGTLSAKAARGLKASPAAGRLDAFEQAIMPPEEGRRKGAAGAKQSGNTERPLN